MATYYVAAKYPVLIESYERFKGPSPWSSNNVASNADVPWSVGLYRWRAPRGHEAKTELAPIPGARPKRSWVGIQSRQAEVMRVLPEGLQELWWTRQLATKDIPWLLHELSPQPMIDTRPGSRINEIFVSVFWLLNAFLVSMLVFAVLMGKTTLRGVFDDAPWGAKIYLLVAVAVTLGVPLFAVHIIRRDQKEARNLKQRALALLSDLASGKQPASTSGGASKPGPSPEPRYQGYTI